MGCSNARAAPLEPASEPLPRLADNPGRLQDFYELEVEKFGDGAYGVLRRATPKSGSTRASSPLKITDADSETSSDSEPLGPTQWPALQNVCVDSLPISKAKAAERFRQEMSLWKLVNHPRVMRLIDSFEDDEKIHLVLELCVGGGLPERLERHASSLLECEVAGLFQQILSAVQYLHALQIVHRDMKLDSFLLQTQEPPHKAVLKLREMGSACQCPEDQMLSLQVGTHFFVAPELFWKRYDKQCDLWSCGVVLYIMLCGHPPFDGQSIGEVLRKVRLARCTFDQHGWPTATEESKRLVRLLLRPDPQERITAQQALKEDWIRRLAPTTGRWPLSSHLEANLRVFNARKAKATLLEGSCWVHGSGGPHWLPPPEEQVKERLQAESAALIQLFDDERFRKSAVVVNVNAPSPPLLT